MSDRSTSEQQKVLWIIFSVALFVLVVVGVGVVWLLPAGARASQAAAGQSSEKAKVSFDPYEWAQTQKNAYPGLAEGPKPSAQEQSGGNFTIIYGQNPQESPGSPAAGSGAPSAVAGGAQATAPAVAPAPSTTATSVVTPAPAPAAPPPAKAVAVVRPAAPRAVPPRPARVVWVTQHWIQAGSYTRAFDAEQVKKLLAAKGLTSLITTFDKGGTTYYRVRIGPYTSNREAKQFLAVVKQIKGFQSSYISLVYTTRTSE